MVVIGHKESANIAKWSTFAQNLLPSGASTSRIRSISSPKEPTWKGCYHEKSGKSPPHPHAHEIFPVGNQYHMFQIGYRPSHSSSLSRNPRPGRRLTNYRVFFRENPNHRYKIQKPHMIITVTPRADVTEWRSLITLVIDRTIFFFNIGITRGNIGFWLGSNRKRYKYSGSILSGKKFP